MATYIIQSQTEYKVDFSFNPALEEHHRSTGND